MSDAKINSVITVILTIILAGIPIYFLTSNSVNKRIDEKINHPDFIKKVAEEIRLPFLIFDKKGTFHTESGGATTYVEKIEPFFENKRFSGFVVYPKKLLNYPPILQAINNDIKFVPAKRFNKIDWKYRIPVFEGDQWLDTGKYDEEPTVLFKLEIIK